MEDEEEEEEEEGEVREVMEVMEDGWGGRVPIDEPGSVLGATPPPVNDDEDEDEEASVIDDVEEDEDGAVPAEASAAEVVDVPLTVASVIEDGSCADTVAAAVVVGVEVGAEASSAVAVAVGADVDAEEGGSPVAVAAVDDNALGNGGGKALTLEGAEVEAEAAVVEEIEGLVDVDADAACCTLTTVPKPVNERGRLPNCCRTIDNWSIVDGSSTNSAGYIKSLGNG